jgi:hypothetical protein
LRKTLVGALSCALILAVASVAIGATSNGTTYEQAFTTKTPNGSTGFKTQIDTTKTADSTGKPKASRRVIVTFARGFEFDTSVLPTCTAATLRARGAAGCPSKSRIGTGEASAVTGLTSIDPVENTVTAFNSRNGILFLIRSKPGEPSATLVIEGKLRGRTLTTTVPKLPQPTPFGEAILTKFSVSIKAARKGRGSRAKYYATAGPCPRSGEWTTAATFVRDNERQTVRDKADCRTSRR